MPSRESPSGSDDGRRVSASRRTFLALTGSAAGAGLSAVPASGRSGGGDPVTVVVSPAEGDAARDAVDRLRETRPTATVSLRVAETTEGLRRFTAGDADVLSGSRPILPAERSLAVENAVDYERGELPTATAALRRPESSWVDCLPPTRLAERWADDGPTETWAEVAPPGVTNGVTRPRPPGDVTPHAARERRQRRASPPPERTALVRGVRASQYASGFGGVGYYEPRGDWIDRSVRSVDRDVERYTPLVRLAFAYVNRESFDRRPVREFVRAYARSSADRVGDVPYFGDPFGDD